MIVQFTVSIMLIIGTIVVYKQIDFAQQRPLGYNRDGLVTTSYNDERFKHQDAIRNDLLQSGRG